VRLSLSVISLLAQARPCQSSFLFQPAKSAVTHDLIKIADLLNNIMPENIENKVIKSVSDQAESDHG
jgi:hypothetical protein